MSIQRISCIALVCSAIALIPPASAAASNYIAYNLNVYPTPTHNHLTFVDMNNAGVMVGSGPRQTGTGQPRAYAQIGADPTHYYWDNEAAEDRNIGSNSYAINNRAQVVGYRWKQGEARQLVRWNQDHSRIDLMKPAGYDSCTVLALNDVGQSVGYCSPLNSAKRHAFLWEDNGQVVDLDPTGPQRQSYATAINNKGQVVGLVAQASAAWSKGKALMLAHPPGRSCSVTAINDAGVMAGSCGFDGPDGKSAGGHAVYWPNVETFVRLDDNNSPYSSQVLDINGSGLAVGQNRGGYWDTLGGALFWENGVRVNLNAALSEQQLAEGWYLTKAFRVNDAGDILALGTKGWDIEWFFLLKRVNPLR